MPTRRSPNGHGQQLLGADQPLQEGLVEMATIGAQSVLWLFLAVGILAAVAGVAVLAWSLRPVPVYLSERVKRGSPFDVEFWIENSSSWFGMSHLSISCVLTYPGHAGPPAHAGDRRAASRQTIATMLGINRETVCKAIKRLRQRGYLVDRI
jgi:hypothetical protein